MDTAAIYNPVYEKVRSVISRATKGEFDEITKLTEVNIMINVCIMFHCIL